MNTIDLTPLYRNTIGFDRLASMLDHAMSHNSGSGGYPPYNIEALDEQNYAITLAVAGFTENDLDIKVERGVLTIRGTKPDSEVKKFLYQGIANRTFERKFNLADHIEVADATLENGILSVHMTKEIPEAMKPKSIPINKSTTVLEH